MNIYIHIPFCTQKCTYCKFALTPVFDEFKKKKYLYFLENEITNTLKNIENPDIQTIYFGGGTPSILTPDEIKNILKVFSNQPKEITLESNPEDINEKYVEEIFSLGINRLSIGIQSLNDNTLKSVERKNSESIFSALESIKSILVGKVGQSIHGQNNKVGNLKLFQPEKISINIDMILGLPEGKKGEILENIKFLHKNYNFITHTSVYILEKGKYPESWQKNSLSDEEIFEEYREICEYFREIGWNHYEVSNWAKPGYECKHNLGYWNHTETLAFGLSASGFLKNFGKIPNEKYFENIKNVEEKNETKYLQNPENKENFGKNFQNEKNLNISEKENQKTNFIRYTNSVSFSGYYQGKMEVLEYLNEEQVFLEKFLFSMRTMQNIETKKFSFLNREKIKKFLENKTLLGDENQFFVNEKSLPFLDFIIDEIIF